MGAWKYRTATVRVGENSQDVRQMTAGERRLFAEKSREIKEGKASATELPLMIAAFSCINPERSIEDVESMPGELLDAVVAQAMQLSGFEDDKKKPQEPDPKQDPDTEPEVPKSG